MKDTTSKSSAKKTGTRPAASSKAASSRSNGARKASNGSSNKSSSRTSKTDGMSDHSKLHKLFEDELKDIYWAEKALTKAIPKMIKKATSEELIEALENHLEETEGHVQRCEQVFEMLGQKAQAKKCEAMSGLIEEAGDIMDDTEEGVMRDAGIISAGQKVEHYEIATYGTLRQFAKTLGLDDIADLLEQTLNEEKHADEVLTSVAESAINVKASQEEVEAESAK